MKASEGAGVGSVSRCLAVVSIDQDGYPISPLREIYLQRLSEAAVEVLYSVLFRTAADARWAM